MKKDRLIIYTNNCLNFSYFLAKSTLPQHGKCWHEALKNLKDQCDKLNDREHSLLALRLTNCFLEDSGDTTYDCSINDYEADRRLVINMFSISP